MCDPVRVGIEDEASHKESGRRCGLAASEAG